MYTILIDVPLVYKRFMAPESKLFARDLSQVTYHEYFLALFFYTPLRPIFNSKNSN